ncbi:cation-translocating P-type ATPase [Pontibacillus sp. HMF3514]|uniref:heavy metal translocating P-type ATPase n=1 Tax=Pontibacillus sp. HMF3514 TaxID=2692425 RepID=UPI00131FF466|nr:cation-translocating P-type ATPase [Pontibacillus sp. HMF3514]QHE51554.1 heavy metal translocating P-type ATPase [Pontibacillus sp. HMF3514]
MITNYTVIHKLPGRTRLRVHSENRPVEIESFFRIVPCVKSAYYTVETQSVLIYHSAEISWEQIVEMIKARLSKFPFENHNQDLAQAKKNLFHIILGSGVVILDILFSTSRISKMGLSNFRQFSSIAALFSSVDIFKNGFQSLIKDHRVNADTLTSSAILASILKGTPKSALVITIMSNISDLLSSYSMNRTQNYVRNMLQLNVSYVWKISESGAEVKVPLQEIQQGDEIAVFIGEKIPVDGIVIDGAGSIDESSITGEYIPNEVIRNSHVYAGSILKDGHLKIKVEKIGEDTTVKKIVHMIEEAQNKKAPIQTISDRISEKLVPVSFLMAGLVYVFTKDWNRVLNMLVIDYVCGLKLSTVTAISSAIGKAAQKGILIKGGEVIESLSKTNTLILDKTGTITEGKPVVEKIIAFYGNSEEDVIRYAASAEEHSSHPIAEGILKKVKEMNVEVPEHDHSQMETVIGRGIHAVVNEKHVHVGNLMFMNDANVDVSPLSTYEYDVQSDNNFVYVSYDYQLIGMISIYDQVRNGMKRTVDQLRRQGIGEIIMLTGDKEHAAQTIAEELHLDSYQAELMPEEKAHCIKTYKQRNNTVMMVGDGINDAPSLAHADIGLTMGAKRTDIAMEASNIIITSDDPLAISDTIRLSHQTMKTIKQNFVVTIVVNTSAILLGSLGVISPIIGAALHNGATILVVLNGAKILFWGEHKSGSEIRYHSRNSRSATYNYSSIRR